MLGWPRAHKWPAQVTLKLTEGGDDDWPAIEGRSEREHELATREWRPALAVNAASKSAAS